MTHNKGTTGIALALDAAGDIMLTTNENGGIDFKLVDGRLEVEQAIRICLQTRLGEDTLSPQVGLPFHEMVGIFNPTFIAAIITQALVTDPRIQSVESVEVVLPDEGRATRIAEVSFTVKLLGGDALSVTEIFGV